MKKVILLCVVLLVAVPTFPQTSGAALQNTPAAKPVPPPGPFDPTRDAARDLQAAIEEAAKTGRRVLVDVGGNWCGWCREMERYMEVHKDLREFRDKNFVTVKINFSPENKNEALLSKYPKIKGYPHLYVLDKDGKLLHSQDTDKIEDGIKSYDLEKYMAFLKEWTPKT
jgi:thiol:disulfide interchange protein